MKIPRRLLYRIRLCAALLLTALTVAAFSGVLPIAAHWLHLQIGAAAAGLTGGFAATLGIWLIITLLFGRFYCSLCCPLGIWQELAALPFRRRSHAQKHSHLLLHLGITALTAGAILAGWNTGLLLAGPYANTGAMLSGAAAGAFLPVAAVTILAIWRRRIFCNSLCPVGGLLRGISAFSRFRLQIDKKCIRCGKCVKVCPAGAIDLSGQKVDNAACLKCLACISRCPVGAVSFARVPNTEAGADLSRRNFLKTGGILLAGAAAGAILARQGAETLLRHLAKLTTGILPPGAADMKRFAAKCIGCQLCTANCPAEIIIAAKNGGDGPVSLDLSRGACRFDCTRCIEVCPTGALLPLTLEEKQRTRIALAHFIPASCRVFADSEKCGLCAGACPAGAITLRRTGAPRLNQKKCIGCGACQQICPAAPAKAMQIRTVAEQQRIGG